MNTSWNGIKFICRQEAFVDHAYRDGGTDGAPRYSIGFGSQKPLVVPGDTIAVADAIRRVHDHVRLNDGWLAAYIKVIVQQQHWDALASISYQKWAAVKGTDERPSLLVKLNANDPSWIADFERWADNSRGEWKVGLHRRRVREMDMAYDGNYGDVDRYAVFAGDPLTLTEYRPFPAEGDI